MAGLLAAAAPVAAETLEIDIFGWVEWVLLEDADLRVKAKLDTGAETSSLDAVNIRHLRRGDKRYVEFSVMDPETGELVRFKRPRVREVRIKRHDGDSQRRPVVELAVCLGGRSMDVEFSLIDRSEFNYPLLLGRRALAGVAMVDAQGRYLQDPECDFDLDLDGEDADLAAAEADEEAEG